MSGDKGVIIAALALLIIACAAPASANVNVTALCLLVTNGDYVASQTNCSSYYQCQGSVATPMSCGSGLYFDKNSQQCVSTVPASCISASNPCQGKAVGSFAASSTSCGGYYYCGASGPVSGQCPAGENFNPITMSCVYANQYTCTMTSGSSGNSSTMVSLNLCNLVENGIYFGNPSNCSSWNYCQNNVLRSGNCPTGMVFNVQQQTCAYRTISSSCAQVTNDPSLTGVSNTLTCTKAGTTQAATACNQYYQCTPQLSLQLQTCPSGNYYDTVSQLCVARMSARNNCDRCVGTTSTFVNSYSSSNCTGYLYCVNGVSQAQEVCPTSYYFNEIQGSCVAGTEPQFLCCNPTLSSGTSSGSSSSGNSTSGSSTSGSSSSGSSTSGSSTSGSSTSGSSSSGSSTSGSSTSGSSTSGSSTSGSSTSGTSSSGTSSSGTSSDSSSTGSSTSGTGSSSGTSTDTGSSTSGSTSGTGTSTGSSSSTGSGK